MSGRIVTLSENTAGQPDLLAEWGSATWVEADGRCVLLDAGAGVSAVHNAERLGIELHRLDKIVLSHGHFDHTGGLRPLLSKLKRRIEIIAHPDIWNPEYSRRAGRPDRFIGIPYCRSELESLGAEFTLSRGPVRISENVLTTGEIPMITDFEKIEDSFFVRTADGWRPDSLLDDQALIVQTPSGQVVILGCGHRGMINTLYHVQKLTGVEKFRLVTGGCHLKDATDEQIWQTVSALNSLEVPRLALNHCTGMRATLILAQTYDANFIFNNTGSVINLA